MRALSIFFAAALLTITNLAQADASSTDPRSATSEQMDKVAGTYKLSDGRRAEIFLLGTRLYIKIGRGQQKQLLLAGPSRFASPDGKVSIQFGPEFDTNRIVLEAVLDIQDTIRLALNEHAGRGSAN